MPDGTFSEAVRCIVPKIPCGKVSTYGRVAAIAGSPRAAQSVANAMGSPGCTEGWHRVVTSRGEVSSRMPERYRKRQREPLEAEEVRFDGRRGVGIEKRLWDGRWGAAMPASNSESSLTITVC